MEYASNATKIVLPAYAGMILVSLFATIAHGYGAPRVCGDDPVAHICRVYLGGVLPAYAGMIHAQ